MLCLHYTPSNEVPRGSPAEVPLVSPIHPTPSCACHLLQTAFPLPVLLTWETHCPPGCQSFLSVSPPFTPHPHTRSNHLPAKSCQTLLQLGFSSLYPPSPSCGPTTLTSYIYVPTSSLFPLQSTRSMAPRLAFLLIECIWKDTQETSNTGSPGERHYISDHRPFCSQKASNTEDPGPATLVPTKVFNAASVSSSPPTLQPSGQIEVLCLYFMLAPKLCTALLLPAGSQPPHRGHSFVKSQV